MPDAKIEVVDSMGYSLYIVAMVQGGDAPAKGRENASGNRGGN